MFLDSDSVLFERRFDDSSNIWYDEDAGISCELRDYLNGDFLSGSFTDAEQAAIAKSQASAHDLVKWEGGDESFKVDPDWAYGAYKKYVGINEKIFVLDAEEASNCEYGYNVSDEGCTSRIKNSGGSAARWWLRSAYSDYAIVREAGGRIYLAKDARWPRELFEAAYPRLQEFLPHRDPGISSALSRRLMGS